MNAHCHKVIFSKRLGTLVAVGEHTASTGKAASGQGCRGSLVAHGFVGALRFTCASVALACLSLGNTQAQSSQIALATNALPQGGSVSTGSATISTSGANMAITQSTDKASINWQSFNIGTGASVNIAQPSSSAVLLNRVVGNDPSQILGQLKANGQVILLNPNGVLFGKDGSVTASAFTASTFGLSDADFMAGYYKYNRNGSTAAVVNQGTIETSAGGFVALIGATVTNEGTIRAPQGDVVMAAAESVTLPEELVKPQPVNTPNTVSVRMSKRVRLELDPAAINTAVNNTESGVIVTEGGQVLLQAAALSSAVASVTHSGRIDTSAPQAGAVTVLADNGVIKVDGSIKANSSGTDNQGQARKGGDIIIGRDIDTGVLAKTADVSGAVLESKGGFVETSGHQLTIDNTSVVAKDWLLDPDNIQITNDASLAAGYTSRVSATNLGTSLSAGTNVTLNTTSANADSGNIYINSAVNKTGNSDATLTLVADNGIIMSSAIGVTGGSGKLNLDFTANGKPGGVTPAAADANSLGIIIGGVGNMSLNGGNLTLTGTSYKSGGAGVMFAPAALSSTGALTAGPTLNISAGNITVNGTANTFSGSSGYGVFMTRYPQTVQLNASGDVSIIGTITGAGTGSAFSSVYSGVTNAANSITAGGALILRGNNRAATSNTSAAVYADGGLQLRSVGNMVIQAETNNAASAAIAFSSSANSTVHANTSLRSIDSSGNASGNVLVQSNQGGISFNNQLADATSSRDIKGVNVTIDNTGAGMATGAGNNVGSGGTKGATVGTGSINATTGAITKGGGSAANNWANGVYLDGRTVSATGNVNIYGVVNPIANGWSYGVNSAAQITAANFSIQGEAKVVGGAFNSGGGGVILADGASISGTAGSGTNQILGTWNEIWYGSTFGVRTANNVRLTTASGSELNITGTNNLNGQVSGGSMTPGVFVAGPLTTSGKINMTGTAKAYDGVTINGAWSHSGGNLSIEGSNTSGRAINNNATVSSLKVNGNLTVTDSSNLQLTGTYTAIENNPATATGYGFYNGGAITGGGGTLTVTGSSSLVTGQTTPSVGIYTNGAISGWGNTALVASNNAGSNSVALQVMKNIDVSSNSLKLQAINGGQIYQGSTSAITAGRVSIDNTNGNIDATTGAITMGTAPRTTGSATRALDLNGAINTTGNIHMAANSGAYINSTLSSSSGVINIQAIGTLENATGGASSAQSISFSSTGGDIIQRANITATAANGTVALDNHTASGRSISRSAGTITANTVNLNAANQIGSEDAGATINRLQIAASNLSMTSSGHQYATGSQAMTAAASSTSGDIKIKTTTGSITIGTVNSIAGITTTGTVDLNAAAAINSSQSISATNLYLTAGTTIGSAGSRINTNASNLSAASAGDQFITDTNSSGVTFAAQTTNNGDVDLQTTVGTLTVGTVNGITGITSHGTGDVTLVGNFTGASGYGIAINSNITAGGNATLTGTTTANNRPGGLAYAGVRNGAVVSAQDITLTASSTNSTAEVLGYYGGAGSLIASNTITATGTSAGSGVGFYQWQGTTQSANGMTITGTSNTSHGVSLHNGPLVKNTTSGNISITGSTADTANSQGVLLSTSTITNDNGGVNLTAASGNISAASGTNAINGKGNISLTAGTNASSAGAIDGTALTITQTAGSSGITTVRTTGTGNVTAPKVVNNGTGNVVVAAGSSIAAGTGTGGQVLTVSGNTITQSSTGKTYIYTGAAANTGVLSNLSADFASLYYNGSSHVLNAAFNSAYNSTITGGDDSQVLFRETTTPTFTLDLATTSLSKTYGQADPTLAAVKTTIQTAYSAASKPAQIDNSVAGVGGNNVFSLTAADAIAALTGSRTAGENVANSPYAYSLSAASLNTTVGGSAPTLTINKADLTQVAASKTYDGFATVTSAQMTTIAGVNGETFTATAGSATISDANVATANKTITDLSGLTLTSSNGGVAGNYNLNTNLPAAGANNAATINAAPLTIRVNNTSAFVTQDANTATDQGVSYTGFVNGETAATALAGSYTRSYTGASPTPAVGSYTGVYSLSATPTANNGNYTLTVQNGNLTVVPADKLLITIASQSDTYGNRTSTNAGVASTVTAEYCFNQSLACSGANIASLTMTQLSGTQWKASDITNSYVLFDTSLISPSYSAGGYLNAGNFTYSATQITPQSLPNASFVGSVANGGVLTIDPLALTLTAPTLSKTYDGTTSLSGRTFSPAGAMSGDAVTASAASGDFASPNVGTGISYTLNGITLSGADAANYSLASNTLSGTGNITAANNNNGGGSTPQPYIKPPQPVFPSDNASNDGGGSSDGSSSGAGNPYFVLPGRAKADDRCTANNLEACLCEDLKHQEIDQLAICYQPKKADNTPSKPLKQKQAAVYFRNKG